MNLVPNGGAKVCTAFGFFVMQEMNETTASDKRMMRFPTRCFCWQVTMVFVGLVIEWGILPNVYAQDISVLSEGANSTTIQVIPDSLYADTVRQGSREYMNFVFRNALTEYSRNGSFTREFIPVMVGVFSYQVQVRVLQADYQTLVLPPPPRGVGVIAIQPPQTVSPFVSYDLPIEQRRHIIVRVRVYPFFYDSLSGKYQILKRVVFQVTSAGSAVTAQNVGADRLLSDLLINYSQVQNAVISQPQGLRKVVASSVLASGTWYKISISKSGIYKLTYQSLKTAGVPVDNIQLSTIRIFNNGGRELPEDPNASRPSDLIENAIYVYNGNTDGTDKFEPNDYILFYGISPRDWTYDSTTKMFSHYLNHYTESNFYFMTFGGQPGKRMQTIPSYRSTSYYTPQSFTCGIAEEDENFNLIGSGKDWFGAKLSPSSSGSGNSSVLYSNTLTGLDQTQNIIYKIRLVSRSTEPNYFRIFENATNTQLGYVQAPVISSRDYTDIEFDYADPLPTITYVGTGNLPNNTSILKISYYSNSSSANGYVDWYEIFYKRKFQAFNDALHFYAPDTNAAVYFSIQGFSSNNVKVFDVSDFANVTMVQDSASNNTVSFAIGTRAGRSENMYAVGDNGYLSVDSISSVQNSDLHGQTSGADLIIITPTDFLSQANQLAAFKQSFDGLKTMVVTTTSIYNEFGCGMPDPTAIRDFLKYAYLNYQITPSYVILFGAGSYDYKNRISSLPEYVPPYETDESLFQIYSYTTDDYFVEFRGPITSLSYPVSMSIGRLPVRNTSEATAVVNKIIQYESKPDFGSWRNLFTIVADGYDGSGYPDNTFESVDAEGLLSPLLPKELDQRKIYLGLYPTVVSTEGIRKPDAAVDIVNQINEGTLAINFIGHGLPDVWSYTHVFNNPTTIPQLTNFSRLSVFIAATCDFARDDDPSSQSGAELLVLSPQGGAIGVVSATRVVIDEQNMVLNKSFIQQLFVRDQQRNPTRIGDAFFRTKQVNYGSINGVNDLKYQYIGDPTVRLGLPRYRATIDSLNGKSLVQVQQIRALSKLDIKGTIYHPDGTVWNDLSSTALLTIYDSQKQVPDPYWQGTYYTFQGSKLFSGEVSVKNGVFEATAVIPTDISYSDTTGKIELYFQANGSDGSGYTTNVIVGGTDTTAVNNHIGPQITVYFDSTNFRPGDYVSQNPTLIVVLHSVNGINLSDAGIGHSLQATFDGQQSVNLAPFYVGDVNSYQDGTVRYPVTMSLAPGEHSVSVRAFDVFNNESDTTIVFVIESSTQLSITNVYNYPDPFSSSTAFTFQRNGGIGEPINVKIKVFTLSGRLIKTIDYPGVIMGNDTFVKIPWDGLDDDGNRLANGVYLYKVIASTIDGSQTAEALGKMAVLR
jgi:hypothetical protein